MKHKVFIVCILLCSFSVHANNNEQMQHEIQRLQAQTQALQHQLDQLQKQLVNQNNSPTVKVKTSKKIKTVAPTTAKANGETNGKSAPVPRVGSTFHTSAVTVHSIDSHPDSMAFYPTALIADEHVVTYIAGTPVVTSPYLGSRPAFDGSDYIVNISSINRDIRLMQQRRRLYRAYESIGYPAPKMPIIAISGKLEPVATLSRNYSGSRRGDINLGSSELDVAAALNKMVEGYMSIAYDDDPPEDFGQRTSNSNLFLNMGFINIGNLDQTPIYFTAGQLFVPYGRFSSAMISSPLTLQLARTRQRPFILGYKSQAETGPFAALYGFRPDTSLGSQGAGGLNLGYVFGNGDTTGEIGASVISTLNDATGLQDTNSAPFTTFGGFASLTNGNERVKKIPGVGVHGNISFDRYNLTAEWVGASRAFRPQDLSFNGRGAKPQAAQLEAGMTFMLCDKPASLAAGYQWARDTLALNIPEQRISGVFNISLWKDTIESLEYRHDIDYGRNTFANGASPAGIVNANTLGSGKTADTLLAQIGVYF
jgi:hypothetical protein